MKWRTDINNAPDHNGAPHMRGTWVLDAMTKEPRHFEANAGYVDDGGEFVNFAGESFGWSLSDYSHWCELPETPPFKK